MPPHANATLRQIRHLPAWIRSTRRHLGRSQARIDLLRKMLDLHAPRHHDVRPSLHAHAAPAAAFQTTRDLLQEILNPTSARFHVLAAPARPRRVTPGALHELRDAHVCREQRSRRGSRPREWGVHREIVPSTLAASRRLRRAREGMRSCARAIVAPRLPARDVARASRDRHLRTSNPFGFTSCARVAAQDAAVADTGTRLRSPTARPAGAPHSAVCP